MSVKAYLGNPPANIISWIKNHSQPAATPSPYFTYDSNRVITGLYQGEPNIQGEGGWTYGGSDVVENYATAIGDYAFNDVNYADGIPPTKAITGNITFQNITSIGEVAFNYCVGLTNIMMPNVTSISTGGFANCESLTNVTMPNVTNIGEFAFDGCSGLTSVTIGSDIQEISSGAFNTNGSLITLTIGKTVAEIQEMGYSEWGLPSGSTIVCTDGNITIE